MSYRTIVYEDDSPYSAGTLIYSQSGKIKGRLTGVTRRCRMEGCSGIALTVRWENGKITYPCTEGLIWRKRSWRIG